MAADDGLHSGVNVVPVAVIVGGVLSLVHVTVLEAVAVLPQASVAVNVLVCDWAQVPLTGPSLDVTVGVPQASVAVADPSAASIAADDGLHPGVNVVPVAVITGGVLSPVHVTVLDVVAVLPQASVAVHVLVCDLAQVPLTGPSLDVTVGVPQASVAVADPSAASIAADDGLHPGVNVVPVAVITGGVAAADQVIVLDVVAVLPQASVAVNVLVCDWAQVPLTGPSLEVTVGVPQASVAVADPSAASIAPDDGLHPGVNVVPVAVIAGGVLSLVHVTVLEAVAVLPQASVAVHVLVCDLAQLPLTAPSTGVSVNVPQASVAVALPRAASIAADDGLHPRVNVVPVAVITGGVAAADQLIVLDVVAVLPQASVAVNVLVCDWAQVPLTGPSLDVTVGVPQASVAVADPSAASIAADDGLHPGVNVVPVAVITGGVLSPVHVTVLEAVAVLPQASVAVHVLVCDLAQVPLTAPSTGVRVNVPQASVAVALPRAASIAADVGLHPRVNVVPVAVITGGVAAADQVIVLDVVAVLPQASVAVNVLVCDLAQLPLTAPSTGVRVNVPQASVAVADPRAASIAADDGLHPRVNVVPVAVITGGVAAADQLIVLDVVAVLPQASVAVNVLVWD